MPVEASPKKCARSFASMSEDDFLDDRDRVTAFDADAAVLRELVGKRLFFFLLFLLLLLLPIGHLTTFDFLAFTRALKIPWMCTTTSGRTRPP